MNLDPEHAERCNQFSSACWERYNDIANSRWDPLRERLRYIVAHVEKIPVIDVGCAEGTTCVLLARAGFTDITGVDIAMSRLEQAREILLGEPPEVAERIQWRMTWAENLPFQSMEFATAIVSETLEHVLNVEEVVQEVDRVLCPNGRIVVSVPFKGKTSELHLRKFNTPEEVTRLFPTSYDWREWKVIEHLPKPKAWLVGYGDKGDDLCT